MVNKSLNNLAPPYMANMFNPTTEIHNRQTRAATRNDLAMPCGTHKLIYDNNFLPTAINIWNNLKQTIRELPSLNSFKSAYLMDYFNS